MVANSALRVTVLAVLVGTIAGGMSAGIVGAFLFSGPSADQQAIVQPEDHVSILSARLDEIRHLLQRISERSSSPGEVKRTPDTEQDVLSRKGSLAELREIALKILALHSSGTAQSPTVLSERLPANRARCREAVSGLAAGGGEGERYFLLRPIGEIVALFGLPDRVVSNKQSLVMTYSDSAEQYLQLTFVGGHVLDVSWAE